MSDPLPEHPRDAEIELTERVATRLFRWANWYIRILGFFVLVAAAIVGFFGFRSFKDYTDFENSINEFNRDVKPQIQQTKEDGIAADAQIKKTIKEAKDQLQAVKKSNDTIAELQREVKKSSDAIAEIQREVQKLKNSVQPSQNTAVPPQSTTPIPKCQNAEVHVQLAGSNERQPPNYFSFPEQRVGTSSEPVYLGVGCKSAPGLESGGKLRLTLTGPFHFNERGDQTIEETFTGGSFTHPGIVFRPTKPGVATGSFTISSPDGVKITPKDFDNPATLTGVGKE